MAALENTAPGSFQSRGLAYYFEIRKNLGGLFYSALAMASWKSLVSLKISFL